MNNYFLAFLILVFSPFICCAQDRPVKKQTEWLIPILGTNVYTNLIVTADVSHLMNCPPELTNRVWNTNLLSLTEQKRLREIETRYQNVSTNNPPPGTTFKESVVRYILYPDKVIRLYPNESHKIEVLVFEGKDNGLRYELWQESNYSFYLRHTDKNGDGFLCKFVYETLTSYHEIKNNKLDGPYVILPAPTKQRPYERDVVQWLMRFKEGKMVGTWLTWTPEGKINTKIEAASDFEMPELLEKLTNYRWVIEDYTKKDAKRP